MIQSRDKISLTQVCTICIAVEYTALIRILGGYTAEAAKQAAWLSGILGIIPLTILIFIIRTLYKKYNEVNFMEIIKDIAGNILGKIIILVYFIWLLLLLALYIRYFAERLISTVTPNINIIVFIISMLIIVSIALYSGITVIARMSEIITPISMFLLFSIFLLGLPLVKIKNVTPIYFTDILPAFAGSAVLWAVHGYLLIFFFFGDQINNKEKILSEGKYKATFMVISNTILIFFIVGSLGWQLTARLPFSTFMFIKQISVFGVIERVESLIEVIWVIIDFISISVFSYIILYIIKDFFKLSTYKPLIVPLMIWAYFLSLLISSSRFELEKASYQFFIPLNIILEYLVPLILLIVGKVRKKI